MRQTRQNSANSVEFITSIEDRATVTTDEYNFTAGATHNDIPVDIIVLVNGIVTEKEGEIYNAILAKGSNEIILLADEYSARQNYTVTFQENGDEIKFESDIEDFTVQNDD